MREEFQNSTSNVMPDADTLTFTEPTFQIYDSLYLNGLAKMVRDYFVNEDNIVGRVLGFSYDGKCTWVLLKIDIDGHKGAIWHCRSKLRTLQEVLDKVDFDIRA